MVKSYKIMNLEQQKVKKEKEKKRLKGIHFNTSTRKEEYNIN